MHPYRTMGVTLAEDDDRLSALLQAAQEHRHIRGWIRGLCYLAVALSVIPGLALLAPGAIPMSLAHGPAILWAAVLIILGCCVLEAIRLRRHFRRCLALLPREEREQVEGDWW